MAVSTIKAGWSKFSARIRDYIDVVDSYYRPSDDLQVSSPSQCRNKSTHNNSCDKVHKHYGSNTDKRRYHTCSSNSDHRLALARSPTSSNNQHNHCRHDNANNQNTLPTLTLRDLQSNKIPRSQLPHGYCKRKTPQGQVYFVDLNGQKHWYDPCVPKELLTAQLNLDKLVGKLSPTWEVRQTSSGKTYFVNHTKKTTQFTDPRLVVYKDHLMNILRQTYGSANTRTPLDRTSQQRQPLATATQRPYSSKELSEKITLLRQELIKQQVLTHPCKIDINRKRIFEESYRIVSQLQPRDLKKRLLVKFRGEEGLDYGGVAREWFYLLSREIMNPVHGLFQYTSGDIYNLQINPDSGIVYREHLSYLNFCGRIMGMAVFHGHFIEGHFTLPFYKMLLRKSITLKDIEHVDPELHRSLCWILENDITNVIDTTFLVQHNAFGQLQEHELKVGGRNIVVTEENKHEYVTLYVNYRCRRGIESQFEALQRGFYELVSPHLLDNFDEKELELLIGGLSKINVDDWRQHTKLKNCTTESSLVIWFWNIVNSYSEDKRAQLLQFVTGSPRVPIQGFKALQGVNSELRLFTIHLIKNACTDNLPKSHTCFNRIDLPPYETYEKLRDKLTQAIEETMGFAMQ